MWPCKKKDEICVPNKTIVELEKGVTRALLTAPVSLTSPPRLSTGTTVHIEVYAIHGEVILNVVAQELGPIYNVTVPLANILKDSWSRAAWSYKIASTLRHEKARRQHDNPDD